MNRADQYWREVKLRAFDYLDKRIDISGDKVWPGEYNHLIEKWPDILKQYQVRSLLDIGCGYGRDSIFFAKHGFKVTGIDISHLGISMARNKASHFGLDINFIKCDFFNCDLQTGSFDCIYLYKFLHQIRPNELPILFNKIFATLSPIGVVAIATFSTRDPHYGRGKMIEQDVYDERGFRPVHYFSWRKLEHFLKPFQILWHELVTTPEQIYERDPNTCYQHKMWYIIARRHGNT